MTRKTAKKRANSKKSFYAIIASLFLLVAGFVGYKSLHINYCANSISCEESFNYQVENDAIGYWGGQELAAPNVDTNTPPEDTKVLGESTGGEKHIFVDLTTQTLTAYEGNNLYMTAQVSTGKWFPTPTGTFKIWEKIKATKMSGGEGNDYYYLPNVPFVMFFSNDQVAAGRGFSLHGAYWHNNFGHPMSHGCVNMRIVDAEKLYYWANPTSDKNTTLSSSDNPGTEITIYGKAPL